MNDFDKGKILLRGDYTQYTPSAAQLFKKNGNYGTIPTLGSIIFFNSKSKGRIAHVGIVVEVTREYKYLCEIKTVEGNTSVDKYDRNGGGVYCKKYVVNTNQVGENFLINGFGYPKFSDDLCTADFFVQTAVNEIGYIEKKSNKDLEDKEKNAGKNNFTKYGNWFGNNGDFWCMQFVSWIAYTACKNYKNGWILSDNSWMYYKKGKEIKGKWEKIQDKWYVFDNSGKMILGWFKSYDDWYYLKYNGEASKGWVYINDNWYVFDDSGKMITGWFKSKDKWYYLDENTGIMYRNCIKNIQGKLYHFDVTGTLIDNT